MRILNIAIDFYSRDIREVLIKGEDIINMELNVYEKSVRHNGVFEYCDVNIVTQGLTYTYPNRRDVVDEICRQEGKETVQENYDKFNTESIRSITITYGEKNYYDIEVKNEEQHTYYVKEEYKTGISNEGGNTATIDVKRGNN